MNIKQIQVYKGLMNLSESERNEVIKRIKERDAMTPFQKDLDRTLLSEQELRVGPTNTICSCCGR